MSLAERRRLRLFTLCMLYVAQGIPWGFMATTLPVYLGARGVSQEALGTALAMTTLPYGFKWMWGPIVDAFTIPSLGRRRPWIVFAQAMMALTVIAMLAIPDVTIDLRLLAWMILIHTVFNALQDVAVDALAVDQLDEHERGRANGLMYASKYLGGLIGGMGMAAVIQWSGLETALAVQTAILLAIMMLPLLIRERSGPPPPRTPFWSIAPALAQAFSIRSTVVTAVLMMTVNLATGILGPSAVVLYTQRLKWKEFEYTALVGGIGLAAGLAGSVGAGFVADRIGHRRMAAGASVALASGWFAFALLEPWWAYDAIGYGCAIFEALAQSTMSVALFALCMGVSWPRIGATQFTTYMALLNFSTTIGYRIGSELSGWSFQRIYLFAAILQLGVTALLPFIDPTETRRKLPLPSGSSMTPGIVAGVGLLLALVVLTIYPFLS